MVPAFSKESQLGKKVSKNSQWVKVREDFKRGKADFAGYYPCNQCGKSFQEIDVDHIIKRSVRPDLVLDINNLQLLCRVCHNLKDNT